MKVVKTLGLNINPDVYNAVFVVPTSVVDNHIKLASGQQLKVLLYVLAHNAEAPELHTVAEGTGLSDADAADALQYWVQTGYIVKDGKAVATPAPAPVTVPARTRAEAASKEKVLVEAPDIVPTYDQVKARTLEDPILKSLFNEIQLRLGKTIGYDTQAKVLMMIDSYGLPPEVILTIFEYAVTNGKTAMAYICKVGKNWAEDGIDSLEKAEERLKEIAKRKSQWEKFAGMITVDTPKRTDSREAFLIKWLSNGNSYDLIYYAYEEMINQINKINFAYMDKILENWTASGYRSPKDVLQAKANGKKPTGKQSYVSAANAKEPSYDVDAYKQKARGPIEYKRRNKDG